MRAAIYGAGSLGTVLGAFITKAGVDIVLVNRNEAHVKALNENGAKIVGTLEMIQPVKAITPDEMQGSYDIIYLMTKQRDNRDIAAFLKPMLAKDGVLCTTQNGLPEPKLMEILGEDRVVGCTVIWGATMTGPGVVKLTSEPDSMSFQIGCVAERSDSPAIHSRRSRTRRSAARLGEHNEEALEKAASLLELMCPVFIENNFIGARWSKLLINATFSGLSVVFGKLFGEIAEDKAMRKVAQRVIKECIDVAKAADIKIMPVQGHDIAKIMDYRGPIKKRIAFMIIPVAMKKHYQIRSSMLYDIERGRKSEIDAVNGVVCDFGKKYNCPTPFNDRIVEIVHGIEDGKYKSSIENLDLFDDLL